MSPTHRCHSLLDQLPPHFILTFVLILFHTVPTVSFPLSLPSTVHKNTKRTPRLRGNFSVNPIPTPTTAAGTAPSNKNMMFVVFGVIGGLVFLALCCYAAQALLKAYQRRKIRETTKSIGTRRDSVDSVWGIDSDRRVYNTPYDRQPHTGTGAAVLSARLPEKNTTYQAWNPPVVAVQTPNEGKAWSMSDPVPAYHTGGYANVPTHDIESQSYQRPPSTPPVRRETLKPIEVLERRETPKPREVPKLRGTPEMLQSPVDITDDRFAMYKLNRSEIRSDYESYRSQTAPVRPPTTPKPV